MVLTFIIFIVAVFILWCRVMFEDQGLKRHDDDFDPFD